MEFRLVKKLTYKGPIKEAPVDYEYWKTRSHEERIAAVEFLRQSLYGKVTPRLQRVYRITKRK
ncbi:MAG: hypothetical protein M3R36_09430 [Bacteroidota bacterium]|nr:hypothetical protein [Bacteroidota bacterium]